MNIEIEIMNLENFVLRNALRETNDWIDHLEFIHQEICALLILERQIIKNTSIKHEVLTLRRINTLAIARLCKYQQFTKTQIEYKRKLDSWSQTHSIEKAHYKDHLKAYNNFKLNLLNKFCKS